VNAKLTDMSSTAVGNFSNSLKGASVHQGDLHLGVSSILFVLDFTSQVAVFCLGKVIRLL